MDLNTLLKEFITSIDLEIATRKQKAKIRPLTIKDGEKALSDSNGNIYRFFEFSYNVFPDSPAEVTLINGKMNKEGRKYNATIIGVDDDVLSLYISGEDLPDIINKALLIIDDTKLLEGVKNTVCKIKDRAENPPKDLANALFGIRQIRTKLSDYNDIPPQFNASQCETVKKALGSDATYIWGPPGTGKSVTLSFIADILVKKGSSILIAAHTNEAVDNLMEKLIDTFSKEAIEAGQIIRWRVTRSEKIQPITPGYIMLEKKSQISRRINELRKEKDDLSTRRLQLQKEYEEDYKKLQVLRKKHDQYQTCQRQYDWAINELKTIELEIAKVENEISSLKNWLINYDRSFFVNQLIRKHQRETFELALSQKLELTINLGIQKEKAIARCREENELLTKAKAEYEQYAETLNSEGITKAKLNGNLEAIAKLSDDLKRTSSEIIDLERELEGNKNFEYELLKNARVMGTTLTSATLNTQLRERTFDVVIVDEVSMAPCPSLYTTCALAKKKAILCGDFYQLSPIAENKNAEWLSKSIFDKLGIIRKIVSGQNLTELTILDTQFRCHPRVANSIIDIVYHGKLKNGYEETHPNFDAQCLEPYANEACILVDLSRICTSSTPWCETKGGSWVNLNSAKLTINLTQQALISGVKSVGIITPYREQARHIKKNIKQLNKLYPNSKVEASTVHRYQGREMKLIIFDLVDCYPKKLLAPFLSQGHGSESMRLINVATTRAIGKLIVIANVDYIEQKLRDNKNAILYQWIQYLKTQRHVYINSISELEYFAM
ncbi:AAA domain-containing protein [Hydrogenispora ethanolica]|uniref:AAA domain-containing protein n=1 Tax=Hydrogenispora ethanolica TaxID=1082276 RepID=A0A4R1S0K1_HYDET|nr:AAA domain-containing protein [Hydrogenispora ethanolica]TCL72449.1 AAA domain-containing protein [Hydrogenispora ethanolica]